MWGERIFETSLKIYQGQLANQKLAPRGETFGLQPISLLSLSKRRSGQFYRLELAEQAERRLKSQRFLIQTLLAGKYEYPEGRLLGALNSRNGTLALVEILALKVADINLDFQVLPNQ